MNKLALSRDERELLKNHFLKSPLEQIRMKTQVIIMSSDGLKQYLIERYTFVKIRTIQFWVKDFHEQRIASLFSGYTDNENASKLTREQKQQIKEVLNKPPDKKLVPKEFWDIPSLKKYIKAEFGVVYESYQSYYFLMKYSNLSFKYPDKFDIRRDEKVIKKRMKEIRKEIIPLLRDEKWEVFTSDETRLTLEAETRKAWLKKGKRTVLKIDREREHQNYLGYLNQKDFNCRVYELDWQNQDEILKVFHEFLKEYPDKKVCIIWDNARFHRGAKIREALQKGHLLEHVHMIALPPYAPDMNPIEHIWGWIKSKLSNKQYQSFEKTKIQFMNLSKSRTFKYMI